MLGIIFVLYSVVFSRSPCRSDNYLDVYLGVGELYEVAIGGVFQSVRGKSEEGNQRIVESCIAYVLRIGRPPVCHVTPQYILWKRQKQTQSSKSEMPQISICVYMYIITISIPSSERSREWAGDWYSHWTSNSILRFFNFLINLVINLVIVWLIGFSIIEFVQLFGSFISIHAVIQSINH